VPLVTGMYRLLGVLQVLPCSSAVGVATTMKVGSPSSGAGDVVPLAKKAHHWSFLPVCSWYCVVRWFTLLSFFLFLL
jgi:hypothetical protein